MKPSKFSNAQKAFIIREGAEGTGGRRDLPQGWNQPGDIPQLEQEVRRMRGGRLQVSKEIRETRLLPIRCVARRASMANSRWSSLSHLASSSSFRW